MFLKNGYVLVHDKTMLLENRVMLQIQRDLVKDEEKKRKIQEWIDQVDELLHPREVA